MKRTNYLKYSDIDKIYEDKLRYRVKCKCGHTCTILNPKGYKICNWCHNYVFLTPKIEFEYRMKEKLNEERRNNK